MLLVQQIRDGDGYCLDALAHLVVIGLRSAALVVVATLRGKRMRKFFMNDAPDCDEVAAAQRHRATLR